MPHYRKIEYIQNINRKMICYENGDILIYKLGHILGTLTTTTNEPKAVNS